MEEEILEEELLKEELQSINVDSSNDNNKKEIFEDISLDNITLDKPVTFQEALTILTKSAYHKTLYCDHEIISNGIPELKKDKKLGIFINVTIPYVAPFSNGKYTISSFDVQIPFFGNKKRLSDLEVQPFFNIEESDKFIERSKKFVKLTEKPYYCHVEGYMYIPTMGGMKRLPLNSRVVVDPSGYKKYKNADRWYSNDEMDKIPEEIFISTLPTVPVYSLEYREWGEVPVEQIKDIVFDETAFERTVLPQDYKDRIYNLVTNFYKTECIDFIAGKKRGLVFLLMGNPGTGKTLTAQGISELCHRPLYSVGTGDLGTDPATIEKRLQMIFDMVGKWNGIVLIDEADVFMAERVDHDVKYNACVSVFLRLIESYFGILFLTTNRDHSIDKAFDSRIHIRLRYSDLEKDGRSLVWKESLTRYNIKDIDVDELSKFVLNNREIANIVQLAFLEVGGDASKVDQQLLINYIILRENFKNNNVLKVNVIQNEEIIV